MGTTTLRCLLAWIIIGVTVNLPTNADMGNRILGGQETSIKEFPYQLSLEEYGRHMCGGSILNKHWALTAAHCVFEQPMRWMVLRAHSSQRETGGSLHPVRHYLCHPLYLRATLDYDVAVVRVTVPFDLTPHILSAAVSLPSSYVQDQEGVTVTGWGYIDKQKRQKPKQLMAADIYVINWDKCNLLYPGLTSRMMCAGDPSKDICSGDSGGPLVRYEGYGAAVEQVGIVSWKIKCGDGWPSVYTNLSTLAPWVRTAAGLSDTQLQGGFLVFPSNN